MYKQLLNNSIKQDVIRSNYYNHMHKLLQTLKYVVRRYSFLSRVGGDLICVQCVFCFELYLHNNNFACNGYASCSITNNLDGGSALPMNDSTLNLTCSEDFYEENLTCVPQCNAWSEKTPSIETTTITVVSTASALGTICGVIGIFASIFQYKSMWELMGIRCIL